MHVREREKELRPRGVRELRPLVAERQDAQAARVYDRLAFVRVERADGVQDRAAGLYALGRRAEQGQLELGQRSRAPTEIRPLREDAQAGARWVHEGAVEAVKLGRERGAIRLDDSDVG